MNHFDFRIAAKTNARGSFANFRYGFHAIPTLALLHLHVISQDFISDSLKNVRRFSVFSSRFFFLTNLFVSKKKHWNSFTTDYFVDAADVIEELQANKMVQIDRERMKRLLDRDLQCHRCSLTFKSMPQLKKHLFSHTS